MSSDFKSDQVFLGLLQDKYISFNIRRSRHNFSPFPRKVTLFPVFHLAKTIKPGIKERSEHRLIRELRQCQNWKKIKNHSFEISPHLFSFLWRFKSDFLDSALVCIGSIRKGLTDFVRDSLKNL